MPCNFKQRVSFVFESKHICIHQCTFRGKVFLPILDVRLLAGFRVYLFQIINEFFVC